MASGSTIDTEAPDSGVGDFVLLSEITMDAFLKNLRLRFEIFTFGRIERKRLSSSNLDSKKEEFTRTSAKFVEIEENRSFDFEPKICSVFLRFWSVSILIGICRFTVLNMSEVTKVERFSNVQLTFSP